MQATPNKDIPEIPAVMAICQNCNQPIVSVMGQPFAHAYNGSVDCDTDARLDPPQ